MTTLLWFRRDLRLGDNPALSAALRRGGAVIPVFILDEAEAGSWAPGGASLWWLHGSLASLDHDLRRLGGTGLVLRRGAAQPTLDALIAETGARAVVWNRIYEPWAVRRDGAIKADLKARGIEAQSFNGTLLREPTALVNQQGQPYRVFTPFWKTLRAGAAPDALPAPKTWPGLAHAVNSDRLDTWALRPTRPDWAGGLRDQWSIGEAAAGRRLSDFLDSSLAGYPDHRNQPAIEGTSRLSPHLHFGEIGPWQVWRAVTAAAMARLGDPFHPAAQSFLAEVAWREFAAHLLFHYPDLPEAPLRPAFDRFAWRDDGPALEAWRRGQTGYPIVDAGMRELWTTGWMHNRVRMIVASFLTKDLMIHWRDGEAWFWDTLVDADLASNAASWQWVAGSGADAAPYFRIFNPVAQGEKFDPQGRYVRRWVPELAGLPDRSVHAPWTASPADLRAAGVALGLDYPHPIVDHAMARRRALDAYGQTRRSDGPDG